MAIIVSASAQTRNDNSIGFYLLKSVKPNKDDSKGIPGEFVALQEDLADTAFIKDEDIENYFVIEDATMLDGQSAVSVRHRIHLRSIVVDRVGKLDVPICCGRQFALVVDGEIVYCGYFWNRSSSFGCRTISAVLNDSTIDIFRALPDNNVKSEFDPRYNQKLIEALKKSGRWR